MTEELLGAYTDAWIKHTAVSDSAEGQDNLDAFLEMLSPDVVYQDIPSGNRYEGPAGVTELCRMVSGLFDMKIDVTSTQRDGDRFAFEYECAATIKSTGHAVTFRGAAVGTIKDGKIASHTDYYDRSGFAPPS